MKKPVDWVHTQDCYDVGVTGTLLQLAPALPEVVLPLMDAWGSFVDSLPSPVFARAMPWPKRTALRVRGWLHLFSPDYFVGNNEVSIVAQIEKFQVEPDSGVALVQPSITMLSPEYADYETVYWKRMTHLFHSTTWTSPEDFNTLKVPIYIDTRMRVPLQDREVIALHLQLTAWGGTLPRVNVRPLLRTLVQIG